MSGGGAVEADVAAHYGHGDLERAIDNALVASGKDPQHLTPDDLALVDEFHVGGREATAALFAQVAPARGTRWLDLGSGLGGPARHLASTYGCDVTGIDLTQEYVDVATELARRVGLAGQVAFRQGSATALPFADASFDGASLVHVGMNIADKPALFAGVRRVLRPGSIFAIYDVMRVGDATLAFPVPWASVPATSFVETPAAYRAALADAGFTIVATRDCREFALDFFRKVQARIAVQGRPVLGLHIVMGETAAQKAANMIANIQRGVIAPVEILARA